MPSPSIWLVTGPDAFLAERAVRDLLAVVRSRSGTGAGAADPLVQRCSLRTTTPGHLALAAGPTLFNEPVVLILTEVEAARADVDPQVAAAIVELLRQPPPATWLLLRHAGGSGGGPLLAAAREAGAHEVACPRLDRRTAPGFVEAEFRRAGRACGPDVPATLCEALGEDPAALAGAVGLLCAVTPAGAVTIEDVRRYYAGRDAHGYEVADSLWSAGPAATLASLRWALLAEVSPVAVVAALARSLRELIAVAAAGSASSERTVASALGLHPYRVRVLRQHARRWRAEDLQEAVVLLARTDVQLKGGLPGQVDEVLDAGLTDLQRAVMLEQAVVTISRSRLVRTAAAAGGDGQR